MTSNSARLKKWEQGSTPNAVKEANLHSGILPVSSSPSLSNYRRLRSITHFLERIIFWGYRRVAKHPVDIGRHSVSIAECTYSPWNFDPDFGSVYDKVRDHTLVDKKKLFNLWQYSRQLASLEGDYIEVGVWRGGTGCLLGLQLKEQKSSSRIFLCDTYEGMPTTDGSKDNFYVGGELGDTSYNHVRALAKSLDLENVVLCKGMFPQESAHLVTSSKFKLVHIDVDIYSSAKDSVEWIIEKLVPGGIIIFDDYGYSATEGVTKFVNEYFKGRTDCLFIYNLSGHGIVVKR